MRREVKFLLSVSLMAAGIEAAFMITRNGLVPAGLDWLILFFYLLVVYLVLSAAGILLIAVLRVRSAGATGKAPWSRRILRFILLGWCYLFALNIGVGLLSQSLLDTPPTEHAGLIIAYGVTFFILTFLFLYAHRNYDRVRSYLVRVKLSPPRVALLVLFSIAVSLVFGTTDPGTADVQAGSTSELMVGTGEVLDSVAPVDISDRPRIIVLGLDCLTIEAIDRLSAEGRVPNLRELIDSGASGELGTIMPTLSPMLWTSIGTGKTEDRHGVHDFRTVRIPGVRPFQTTLKRVKFASATSYYVLRNSVLPGSFFHFHHYTSGMRTCKSLWNILSEHGRRVGVVGWYITWPAEPVNGFLVTSRSFLYSNSGDVTVDPGLTYPEELFHDVAVHNDIMTEITLDSLAWLCDQGDGGDPELGKGCMDTVERYFEAIRKNYARDLITLRVTLDLMERYDSLDVLMVYFRAVDSLNHIVFNDTHYGQSTMGDELYLIPDNYYEFIDRIVGRIRGELDDGTTLMIVSDHGWDRANGHPYAPPGAIIMNGKHVVKGCRIEDADIFDVTPTVLALAGLPLGRDMTGRPLLSCIEEGYRQSAPLHYVATYEEGPRTARSDPDRSSVDDQIDEQLKALGYIE